MSGLLVLRALLFAGECFAASLLLPLLAFAVSALLRRRAALRHLIFTTMFGVLAVLPVVALLLPPRRIVEHAAAPVASAVAPVIAAPPSLLTGENIVLLLVGLWLAGLAWQLLRLGVGGLGLARLRRRSAPFATETSTGCAVRLSEGEQGPSTFGIVRPVVLLPRSAPAWPAARLEAVLRHEAAHVARRDTLSQLIARLVCAVFWPNPLLWLGLRALRRDAEIAADDAVLASGLMPSLYAAALVSLAAEARGLAPGIAMAGSPLAERVDAVLADNVSRKGVTKMDMARTATLGLTAALLLGAARFDIAVAQDAPAPSMAPQVEKRVDVNLDVQARTATIKAQADAVTARAKAKAAAEKDPAKAAQYARDAAQVAAQSAQVKAQADEVAADARQRLAEARPRLAQMQLQALQLAQAAPQVNVTVSPNVTTTNGVTTYSPNRVLRVDGVSAAAMAETLQRTAQARQSADAARRESQRVLASIGPEIEKAIADAHIQEAVAKALADAHIDEKIAKALADANLDAHAANLTGAARMLTIMPNLPATVRGRVTITPAAPPVPHALTIAPAPPAPPAN